jgi:hypothetical protein
MTMAAMSSASSCVVQGLLPTIVGDGDVVVVGRKEEEEGERERGVADVTPFA